MQYTDNYQFREPTPAVDIVKVGDINYNSRKIDELIHSTQVSLAPAYDETRTSSNPYMTGDVVMKDALMYRCLDDDVYGAWDATKWERTTAGEEGAGGSSVEANPQGTPTDDLDTIGINGTIYNIAGSGGGGGNVYGAFIDTNRVIKAITTVEVGTIATYTATEDCMVIAEYYGKADSGDVSVDGVIVSQIYCPNDDQVNTVVSVPLRRGQTISIKTRQYTGGYTVYGLTFGTQNIFTPQIYSTEERCVGVWIDNKPLYAKTVEMGNVATSTAKSVAHGISNLDTVAHIEGTAYNTVDAKWTAIPIVDDADTYQRKVNVDDTYVILRGSQYAQALRDVNITIIYTKTTDTAGSGSYNTLGVPMVHYSTDEQVVGTWVDGKTLYQKTYIINNPTAGGVDVASGINVDTIVQQSGTWERQMQTGVWTYDLNAQNEIGLQEQFVVLCRYKNQSNEIYYYYTASGAYNGAVVRIIFTIQYTKSSS